MLIKGLLKRLAMLNSSRNTHLIETSYDRLEIKRNHISAIQGKFLAKVGVFPLIIQISMNIKDITIPLIIHYYLLESIQNTTQIFPMLTSTSGFSVSAPGRWHNAIRVRAKPCVHRFNYSYPAEKFPVRAVDIVNPTQ